MKLILSGRKIGLAVKSAQRLRQIAGVLAHHGFADIFHRMNLSRYIPGAFSKFKIESESEKSAPERLREAFEKLGPSFVKLGQLLSTRPDIVPENFITELVKLQDNVQTLSFDIIKTAIERELGGPIENFFESVDPTPLASASIAQVHKARLKTGEEVVLKVQRPDIEKTINQDIAVMTVLAGLLEKYVPELRIANPTALVEEFFLTLRYELDFLVEANNMQKIAENLAEFKEIRIPKVYRQFSTKRLLTLERFDGIRLNDTEALNRSGVDKKRLAEVGAKAFLKAVMIDGLFHGDLHGGNLFVLRGEEGDQLGIIDFGIVGRLSQRARNQFANMILAIFAEDFESLAYDYAELGAAPPSVDFEAFQRDLRNAVAPYMGLNISEVNSGKVLVEATKIATKYEIRVPGEWMIVFKAILTMEGMGRSLDPEFDILGLGQDFITDLIKVRYSPQKIGKEFWFIAKEFGQLFQALPRHLRWMLRKFNRNDFALEVKIKDLPEILKRQESNSRRIAAAIVVMGSLIAGSIAMTLSGVHLWFGYPVPAILLFIAAGIAALRLF